MSSLTAEEDLICDVCSESISIFSVGKCDHPICYKCATRMRVLCAHTYCPICRADLPKVVFSRKLHGFGSLNTSHYPVNRKQKIYFEDGSVQDAYYELLQHSCKLCKSQKFSSFYTLQTHLKREHELFYCDLCVKHLKNFSHERKSYTRQDLARHRRLGDVDDTSHKGHPLCQFCDERYLDNDELARHLRKDHYYCHFCEADGHHHYYSDYNILREHFKEDHFLCEEGECYKVQFTNAFRTKIDYQAHLTQSHGKGMKKSQARQARTLDIEFSLAPRTRERDRGVITGQDYEESRQNASRGRGRGRGYRREGRQQTEKDEEALSQALTASQVDFETQNEYKEEVQDFPSLRETSSKPVVATENNTSNSMAKNFARNTNKSVQEGSMQVDEFPALGNGAPVKQYPLHPKQQVWTKSSPKSSPQMTKKNAVSHSSASGHWGSQTAGQSLDTDYPALASQKRTYSAPQSSAAPMGRSSDRDYPALASQKRTYSVPQSSAPPLSKSSKPTSGVSKKNQAAALVEDYPSLGSANKSVNKLQSFTPVESKKKSKKPKPVFSNEEDFPTLGGSSQLNTGPQQPSCNLASILGGKKQSLSEIGKGISPDAIGKRSLNLKGDDDFPSLGGKDVVSEAPEWKAVPKKTNKSKKVVVKAETKEPTIPGAVFSKEKKMPQKSDDKQKSEEKEKSDKNEKSEEKQVGEKQMSGEKNHTDQNKKDASSNGGQKEKKKKKKKGKNGASNTSDEALSIEEKEMDYKSPEINFELDMKNSVELISSVAHTNENKMQSNKENIEFPTNSVSVNNDADECDNDMKPHPFVMDDGDFPSLSKPEGKKVTFSLSYSSDEQSPQREIDHLEFPNFNEIKLDMATIDLVNDFPTLTSISQGLSKPPPGMGKSSKPPGYVSRPPPGVSSKPPGLGPSSGPPPGVSTPPGIIGAPPGMLNSLAKQLANNADGASKTKSAPPGLHTDNGNVFSAQSYLQPTNFAERNQQLIALLQDCIENNPIKFKEFKTCSGKFRQNTITAAEYYRSCKDILGSQSFSVIFPELLVLLPDINKQQELLTAHNMVYSFREPSDFESCPMCNQVLARGDVQSHVSDHRLDGFPSLGVASHKLNDLRAGVKT